MRRIRQAPRRPGRPSARSLQKQPVHLVGHPHPRQAREVLQRGQRRTLLPGDFRLPWAPFAGARGLPGVPQRTRSGSGASPRRGGGGGRRGGRWRGGRWPPPPRGPRRAAWARSGFRSLLRTGAGPSYVDPGSRLSASALWARSSPTCWCAPVPATSRSSTTMSSCRETSYATSWDQTRSDCRKSKRSSSTSSGTTRRQPQASAPSIAH